MNAFGQAITDLIAEWHDMTRPRRKCPVPLPRKLDAHTELQGELDCDRGWQECANERPKARKDAA